MKKENGEKLKSDKLFNIAKVFSRVSLGFTSLALVGVLASFTGAVINASNQDKYLDSVSETAQYQEFFEDENQELEDAMYGREITPEEYIKRREELEEKGVVKYIEENGTDEQKAELDKFMAQGNGLDIAGRVFRDISFPGVGIALVGVGISLASAHKAKKEIDEEIEKMLIGDSEELNPFPEYSDIDTNEIENEDN